MDISARTSLQNSRVGCIKVVNAVGASVQLLVLKVMPHAFLAEFSLGGCASYALRKAHRTRPRSPRVQTNLVELFSVDAIGVF